MGPQSLLQGQVDAIFEWYFPKLVRHSGAKCLAADMKIGRENRRINSDKLVPGSLVFRCRGTENNYVVIWATKKWKSGHGTGATFTHFSLTAAAQVISNGGKGGPMQIDSCDDVITGAKSTPR